MQSETIVKDEHARRFAAIRHARRVLRSRLALPFRPPPCLCVDAWWLRLNLTETPKTESRIRT